MWFEKGGSRREKRIAEGGQWEHENWTGKEQEEREVEGLD